MNIKQAKDYIKRLKRLVKKQRADILALKGGPRKKTGGTTAGAQKK